MADSKPDRPGYTFLQEMNNAFDASYASRLVEHAVTGGQIPRQQIEDAAVTFTFLVAKETTSNILAKTQEYDRGQFQMHPDLVEIINRLSDVWMPIIDEELPTSSAELKALVSSIVEELNSFPEPIAEEKMDFRARHFYYDTMDHFRAIKLFFDKRVNH